MRKFVPVNRKNRYKMMKKVLLMLLVMFALSSCQSKDSYVSDFSDFVEEVASDAEDFSEKDWEKADKDFEKFATTLYEKYEEELSSDQKAEIVKLESTYVGLKMKHGMRDAAKKMNKFFDGLQEGTK